MKRASWTASTTSAREFPNPLLWRACVFPLIVLLPVVAVSPAAGSTYNGYNDQTSDGGSFGGVVATIECQATVVVNGVSVWVGIDDGRSGSGWWYQSGWRQLAGDIPRAYFEWVDGEGKDQREVSEGQPPSSGDYSLERNGPNVTYVAGNILAGSVPWTENCSCWAQYVVELHDEAGGDQTPGTSSDPLTFQGIEVRVGGSWGAAPLAIERKSTFGHVSKSGNSISVYDTR